MTTTATLRDTFLDLTPDQVSAFAGLIAQHLLLAEPEMFARMMDEAKAVA